MDLFQLGLKGPPTSREGDLSEQRERIVFKSPRSNLNNKKLQKFHLEGTNAARDQETSPV